MLYRNFNGIMLGFDRINREVASVVTVEELEVITMRESQHEYYMAHREELLAYYRRKRKEKRHE